MDEKDAKGIDTEGTPAGRKAFESQSSLLAARKAVSSDSVETDSGQKMILDDAAQNIAPEDVVQPYEPNESAGMPSVDSIDRSDFLSGAPESDDDAQDFTWLHSAMSEADDIRSKRNRHLAVILVVAAIMAVIIAGAIVYVAIFGEASQPSRPSTISSSFASMATRGISWPPTGSA